MGVKLDISKWAGEFGISGKREQIGLVLYVQEFLTNFIYTKRLIDYTALRKIGKK